MRFSGFMVYGVLAMNWHNIKAHFTGPRSKDDSPASAPSPLAPIRDIERLSPGTHPATRRV